MSNPGFNVSHSGRIDQVNGLYFGDASTENLSWQCNDKQIFNSTLYTDFTSSNQNFFDVSNIDYTNDTVEGNYQHAFHGHQSMVNQPNYRCSSSGDQWRNSSMRYHAQSRRMPGKQNTTKTHRLSTTKQSLKSLKKSKTKQTRNTQRVSKPKQSSKTHFRKMLKKSKTKQTRNTQRVSKRKQSPRTNTDSLNKNERHESTQQNVTESKKQTTAISNSTEMAQPRIWVSKHIYFDETALYNNTDLVQNKQSLIDQSLDNLEDAVASKTRPCITSTENLVHIKKENNAEIAPSKHTYFEDLTTSSNENDSLREDMQIEDSACNLNLSIHEDMHNIEQQTSSNSPTHCINNEVSSTETVAVNENRNTVHTEPKTSTDSITPVLFHNIIQDHEMVLTWAKSTNSNSVDINNWVSEYVEDYANVYNWGSTYVIRSPNNENIRKSAERENSEANSRLVDEQRNQLFINTGCGEEREVLDQKTVLQNIILKTNVTSTADAGPKTTSTKISKEATDVVHEPQSNKTTEKELFAQFFTSIMDSENKNEKKVAVLSILKTFSASFSGEQMSELMEVFKQGASKDENHQQPIENDKKRKKSKRKDKKIENNELVDDVHEDSEYIKKSKKNKKRKELDKNAIEIMEQYPHVDLNETTDSLNNSKKYKKSKKPKKNIEEPVDNMESAVDDVSVDEVYKPKKKKMKRNKALKDYPGTIVEDVSTNENMSHKKSKKKKRYLQENLQAEEDEANEIEDLSYKKIMKKRKHSNTFETVEESASVGEALESDNNVFNEKKTKSKMKYKTKSIPQFNKDLKVILHRLPKNVIRKKLTALDQLSKLSSKVDTKKSRLGNSVLTCEYCNFIGRYMALHYKQSHPEQEVCSSKLSSKAAKKAIKDAQRHIDLYERQANLSFGKTCLYKCRFCSYESIVLPKTFYDHVSTHTGEFRYSCSGCSFSCASTTTIKSHLDKIHPTEVKVTLPNVMSKSILFGYMCEDCFYVQTRKKAVKEHIKKHSDNVQIYKINMSSERLDKKIKISQQNQSEPEVTSDRQEFRDTQKREKPCPLSKKKDYNKKVEGKACSSSSNSDFIIDILKKRLAEKSEQDTKSKKVKELKTQTDIKDVTVEQLMEDIRKIITPSNNSSPVTIKKEEPVSD